MISQEIIFAGFLEQGILTMAEFLAYAAMEEELNVSWLPIYEQVEEMKYVNCSVILTDDLIKSPLVTKVDTLVVMNKDGLKKYESYIKPGGLLIMNSDLIDIEPRRNDIKILKVPANNISTNIGTNTVSNLVLLGVMIEKTYVVSIETLIDVLKLYGSEHFFNINKKAIEAGVSFCKK